MSGWRLPAGGGIDRKQPIEFSWDGRTLSGYAGDTLASALLANGVNIVGRSFKLHRPRGLLAAGVEEPNAIVQVDTGRLSVPNLKATLVELYEGLRAVSVNTWPDAQTDRLAALGWGRRLLPAGFYYKTFLWPSWSWYEPWIRRAAGLGRVPTDPDPDNYTHRHAHCDVLVIGGGRAGLMAARDAARKGQSVILAEGTACFGGRRLSSREDIDGNAPGRWIAEAVAELTSLPNVKILSRTFAFGVYDHGLVGLDERLTDHLPHEARGGFRQRLWKVRAGRIVLATGAFERPLAFAGNDRPGVMLASAAATYALRYGAAPGRRLVVVTNNDSAYRVAADLVAAGVDVTAVVDTRDGPRAATALCSVEGRPLRIVGRRQVEALRIVTPEGRRTLECDCVLMSGGWNPVLHLHGQIGGRLRFDPQLGSFVAVDRSMPLTLVGRAAGQLYGADACSSPIFAARDADASAAWLDFQNDVTVGDVRLAVREGMRSVEHVKRYTTLGMATDGGKTANVSAIFALADARGDTLGPIGTTRFRPPFDPVTVGALAGRAIGTLLLPEKRTALDAHQRNAGGVMQPYGRWSRAAVFLRENEDEKTAVAREVRAVRASVGLFDASPLGKIEIVGPDAAEFLEHIYVQRVATLQPGRCRYAVMLDEHGIVFDDGIVARLAPHHFLLGTTSGHADRVAEILEEWSQCEWPNLEVMIEDVTNAWSVVTVAGPRSRDLLRACGTDIDVDRDAFPHLNLRSGSIAGLPVRVQRVSFSGELSYEVSVPALHAPVLWSALTEAARRANVAVVAFGVEALMVMRVEKGFVHIGAETDGTTMPHDIGITIAPSKTTAFIGRRSLGRPAARREDRRRLVGIETMDGGPPLAIGAHCLAHDGLTSIGWVTSSVASPTLGRPIALGMVQGGVQADRPVAAFHAGASRMVRIVPPLFFDPDGTRMRG